MKGFLFPVFGSGSVLDNDSPINKEARDSLRASNVRTMATFAQIFYGLDSQQIDELKAKALKTETQESSGDLTSILRGALLAQLQKAKPESETEDEVFARLRRTFLTGVEKK